MFVLLAGSVVKTDLLSAEMQERRQFTRPEHKQALIYPWLSFVPRNHDTVTGY